MPPNHSDETILSMLRQKGEEEQGFRLLTAKYGHSLYRHIRRTVIAHEDAEDVLQETMIQIFCHLETFKGEAAQLKAWIFRIATNEALMHLRRQTRFYESIDDVNPQLLARLQSEDTRSADDVERLLQEALLNLPTQQRMVFNMRYFEDLSYQEISEITGKNIGTLKTNYHYATERVKQFITENHDAQQTTSGVLRGEF